MEFKNILINLFFPEKCIGCGKLGSNLCPKCKLNLHKLDFPICMICENLSINGATHKRCKKPFTPTSFNSGYIYNPLVKKIILKSKSGSKSYSYLNLLINKSQAMADLKDSNIDLITFIPLSKRKGRLIDHAEYIAKALEPQLNKTCVRLFKSTKNMQEQKYLNKYDRVKNTATKFSLTQNAPRLIKGKSILLIDDVCTTGSSLISCAKLLMQNGAINVHCYTLAKDLKRNSL